MKRKIYNVVLIILSLLISLIVFAFILSPFLLKFDSVNAHMSNFLFGLKTSEYKSSYIESLGALLGTFFAVTAALLTQKFFDKSAEKKELKECATIIYYDFEFAINQIIDSELSYNETQRRKKEKILDENFNWYEELRGKYAIYIDDEWIHNVAKLSHFLSSEHIKTLYDIYGDLNSVKLALTKPLPEEDTHLVFASFILKHIKHIPRGNINNIKDCLNNDGKEVVDKLMQLGEIKSK